MNPDTPPPLAIAIDGPAASGKTTVGAALAQALGFLFLDTGCMYRAVTLAALQRHIPIADEHAVTHLAQTLDLEISGIADQVDDGRDYTVYIDGKDVTWDLRAPDVDANVSQVSAYAGVRRELVRRQREIGRGGAVVMVGRDIGTVVLPDAPLKVYIVASAEERARRRWQDRQARGNEEPFEAILDDVRRRDRFDGSREHAPMRPAEDAVLLDTTDRDPAAIIAELQQMVARLTDDPVSRS